MLYWFLPAERWPRHQAREQLTRIWDAFAGRPQYAFVRLAALNHPNVEAEQELREFARTISWPVRLALSVEDAGHGVGAGG